jgi:hypothetical protein
MTAEEFQRVLDDTISQVKACLGNKAAEYATEDRLNNFKKAAHLKNSTYETALLGMMVKHTVSIYDMVERGEIGETFPGEMWDEKIIDHINYLILLKAIIIEKVNLTDKEN